VCKELHRACHWLKLKFNPTLKFKSAAAVEPTATQNFLSFLHVVPTHMRAAIKVVELCSGAAGSPEEYEKLDGTLEDKKNTLFHLADVCRYNPHITVKYRLRILDRMGADSEDWPLLVVMGICVVLLLRNQRHDDAWLRAPRGRALLECVNLMMGAWAGYDVAANNGPRHSDVARLQAANLRFLPMDGFIGNLLEQRGKSFGAVGQDLMPEWERLMKQWVAEGF
jgi:hypothetical protein